MNNSLLFLDVLSYCVKFCSWQVLLRQWDTCAAEPDGGLCSCGKEVSVDSGGCDFMPDRAHWFPCGWMNRSNAFAFASQFPQPPRRPRPIKWPPIVLVFQQNRAASGGKFGINQRDKWKGTHWRQLGRDFLQLLRKTKGRKRSKFERAAQYMTGFNMTETPTQSHTWKTSWTVCLCTIRQEWLVEKIHACIDLRNGNRRQRRCKQTKREIIQGWETCNLPLCQPQQHNKAIKQDSFACYLGNDIYP